MKFWKLGLLFLLLISSLSVLTATKSDPGFKIIACDVGQGSATLAVRGTVQILIDGGPDDSVLTCLDKFVPFWDRQIELVVLTHPDADHHNGFRDVFSRYKVDTALVSGLDSGSQGYKALKNIVGGSGAEVVLATAGQKVSIGLIQLDILWPTEEIRGRKLINTGLGPLEAYSGKDRNNFSVVTLLSFGEFDALLTGDIETETSDTIAEIILAYPNTIEYLEIPHHGSKNGLTEKLLKSTNPDVAVISVGKENRYGHPHEEVMKLLKDGGVKVLRTDEMGDVVISP